MNDYSHEHNSAFEGLQYKQVCSLLDILKSIEIPLQAQVRRIYSENEQGFEKTLRFLLALGLVKENEDHLSLVFDWANTPSEEQPHQILNCICKSRNDYRSEIFNFLERFSWIDSALSYSSPVYLRSQESGVRNFLIELEIVEHDPTTQAYLLSLDYISLYADALEKTSQTSPILLSKIHAAKETLGTAAENIILNYEKNRIGDEYASKLDHVAIRNTAAGYDIRSVTIEADGSVIPRLIEVKAVPHASYRFYWSSNEIKMARHLKGLYYLYLLPVISSDSFELDSLKIIKDPSNEVLNLGTEWETESDGVLCYLPTT